MRRVWIGGAGALLVIGLLACGVVRHFTSTAYIEKRLTTMMASGKGVNQIKIGASHFNLFGGTLSVRDLEFVPDTTVVAQRIKDGKPVRTRNSVMVSTLRVEGIRVWPLLRRRIVVDSISVDSARVAISVVRAAGPRPAPKPAILPQVYFQKLGMPVRIDAIRMTNSAITYSEVASDGARPGTIRFSGMDMTISNVTNDSTSMTSKTPCTIQVSTLLNEAGRLDATFGYDLLSPKLNMICGGTVSRMQAEPLNELLENLNGIKITSGVVDSARFDFKIEKDDVARGKVEVLYHDLNIQMKDKVTLEQDLMARLKSFINDKAKMHGKNPRDEDKPATVAIVARERTPQTPLIKFLWETLREGILTTLGV